MTLHIAICDDEQKQINTLSKFLTSYEFAHNIDFSVDVFTNAQDLLAAYSSPSPYEIIFLDVEMPEIDGLSVAKQIRNLGDRTVKIIFISNYPKYMQSSFGVQAFYYLQKPVSDSTFHELLTNIINYIYEENAAYQLVPLQDGSKEIINLHTLLYVESIKGSGSKLRFVLENKCLDGKGAISEWEGILQPAGFLCTHRCYMVNPIHIYRIRDGQLTMDNGDNLPLSRRKEKEVRGIFSHNIIANKKSF